MAKEYTADQKARVNAAFKAATKGTRRPRLNKYEKAAVALGAVADDFRGFDRDAISRVIDLMHERADPERPAGKYAAPGEGDF